MTTNNPEVVAWLNETWRSATESRPVVHDWEDNGIVVTPLVRLSDYETLQAENEQLRRGISALVEALERLVGDVERATHVEFGGTPWLEEKMAEIDYARAALAAHRKGGEV